MGDPDDSRNQLARRSRVSEATAATLILQDLPPELILRIASSLEVRDLSVLRRSNRYMYNLSQDKHLWGGLLRNLRLPLSRTLRSCRLDSLSYPELEEAVLDSYRVEHRWLKRREPSLTLPAVGRQFNIRLLEFLDDRWIVSIPTIGSITIWDIQESPPKLCESASRFPGGEIREAAAVVDPDQGDIIIGLRKREFALQILRAYLAEPRGDSLQFTDYGTIHDPHPDLGIITVEPSRSAIITGLVAVDIEVRDWTRGRSVVTGTTGVNYDIVYEPVLGLRLVGDYIVSFRSRWMELLYVPPFPDADERLVSKHDHTSHPFHIRCQEVVFQSASLSEPQPNPDSVEDSHIIYILAHQTWVGFFYFRVTIYDPDYVPSGRRARMDVDLFGVYELNKPQVGIRGTSGPRMALEPRLGPEGKRGIWIERPLNKRVRFVVAVSFDQSCPGRIPMESGDDLQKLCETAPRIESTADVFVVDCWNPNDDIARCAFSESTGKIVLVTIDGRIILL